MNSNIQYFTIAQAKDPWQPYEQGKKKPKPGVPEVDSYGIVFSVICFIFIIWRTRLRNKNK